MSSLAGATPPEVLDVGGWTLRRHRVEDAEGIAAGVRVSLPELRLWMPWASEEAGDAGYQRCRLEGVVGLWEEGADFSYVVLELQEQILGVMSLMPRIASGGSRLGTGCGRTARVAESPPGAWRLSRRPPGRDRYIGQVS